MQEFVINNLEEGQRFDKYLTKRLPGAGKSFIYKMLRKKNITLNSKKADGSEKIACGDIVKMFFSEETYDKFSMAADVPVESNNEKSTENQKLSGTFNQTNKINKHKKSIKNVINPNVIYEDDDILVIDKPSGMLSQKAEAEDYSLIEYITDYLFDTGYLTKDIIKTFHPGICNRLDRNTSGIVVAGKTIKGLQNMSAAFKERTLHKYYICIVSGKVTERKLIKGYLIKNKKSNQVKVYNTTESDLNSNNIPKDALPIETEYIPVKFSENLTLLKVNLITGRSHQIRAHLASVGHSIIGDAKYGNSSINSKYKNKYYITSQMLHAYELYIPQNIDIPQKGLNVKTDIPKEFLKVIKGEQLWEPGIQEDLEALH